MNVNRRVRVILTDYGLEAYRAHYRQMHARSISTTKPSSQDEVYENYYKADCTRTEPVLVESLWRIMNIFGVHMEMHLEIPFVKNEIVFIRDAP